MSIERTLAEKPQLSRLALRVTVIPWAQGEQDVLKTSEDQAGGRQ